MDFLAVQFFALSLCADCFAVSACSSVTVRKASHLHILAVSLLFAVVHVGLLLAGWSVGGLFAVILQKVSRWVGLLILLYVGGTMIWEAIRGKELMRNLSGWGNVLLGALATSIDALAVGVSLSMEGESGRAILAKAAVLFFWTVLSVGAGIAGGMRIGKKWGMVAEVLGGIILITLGVLIFSVIL